MSPQYRWLETHAQADRGLLQCCLPSEFLRQAAQLATGPKIGVAVSGGGDSIALLHLIARAAPHFGLTAEAATINHHLRPEAAEEAAFVADVASGLGLAHQTLNWNAHPETGNLMQAAGQARLDLLATWAKARGIATVFLGHTADDQAETFLMGLSRASGIDGLTGMRPSFEHAGVQFWRPLLQTGRASLRDFLTRHSLPWCEDPSNQDDRYTRVRIRKALPDLAALGITLSALRETISNLTDVQDMLRHSLAEGFARFGTEEAGSLNLARADFAASPAELQRRLFVSAARWISGNRHPPRAETVSQSLTEALRGRGSTFGGCLIRVTAQNIRIFREPQAAQARQAWQPGMIWDHRWKISGPARPGLEVRALTAAGLAQVRDWRDSGLRRDAVIVSPGLWQGERLIAAPLLPQFAHEWCADLYPSFGSFILSH
nr:tRNA lysidine(34) synthetase TilS [Pseudogemmobacter hezensis]